MFAEVFDVLRVYQIFLACILVVVLLEVVYLILVLIVTMMSRSEAKVGELFAILCVAEEGFSCDTSAVLGIKDLEDFYNR